MLKASRAHKSAAATFLLLFPPLVAVAQLTLTGVGGAGIYGLAFTGPIDVVSSPSGCWSLRACSSAKRGTNAVKVCTADAGGGTCATWVTDVNTGNLVATTIGGTDCTSSTCYANQLIDQGANGITLSTVAHSPTMVHNCINSTLWCMAFNGTTQTLCGTGSLTVPQPLTHSAVGKRTGNTAAFNAFMSNFTGSNTNGPETGAQAVANKGEIYAGTVVGGLTMNDNAFHAFQVTYNGSSSATNIDGTETTSLNPGTGSASVSGSMPVCLGEADTAGDGSWLTGNMVEALIYPIGFSSGQRGSMHTNQSSYWGTP